MPAVNKQIIRIFIQAMTYFAFVKHIGRAPNQNHWQLNIRRSSRWSESPLMLIDKNIVNLFVKCK